MICTNISYWFLLISIIIIGSRQRALASLLHEAAHGTLFASQILNKTIGRAVCGWTILQSFFAYRRSHVLSHHPKIGEKTTDPDLIYMINEGVYNNQNRARFTLRYLVMPLLGIRTPHYVWFLLRNRLFDNLINHKHRFETVSLIGIHIILFSLATWIDLITELILFWWLPYITTFATIGWLSELSEHFPMMTTRNNKPNYCARNRYAAWFERLIIGIHGDNYHLTHHLLPGIPHWNLKKATNILREDTEFRAWDDSWGGIFSSDITKRVSLISYIINDHPFSVSKHHSL